MFRDRGLFLHLPSVGRRLVINFKVLGFYEFNPKGSNFKGIDRLYFDFEVST